MRPATALAVAGVVADVLRLDAVQPEDDLFALGLGSLTGVQLVSRIRDVFGVELDFLAPFEVGTVDALAALVEQTGAPDGGDAVPLVPVPPEDAGLSAIQEGLLRESAAAGYIAAHVVRAYHVRGPVDVTALRWALGEIVRRHQTLRTSFPTRDGAPYLLVRDSAEPVAFDTVEVAADDLYKSATRFVARRFDLAAGPLYRFRWYTTAPEHHVLVLCLHELVGDGWSMDLLARELSALYRAALAGEPSPLPELAVQYADFAAWKRRSTTPESAAELLDFWREQLAGVPLTLAFPFENAGFVSPPPRVTGAESVRLSDEVAAGVRELCANAGVTPFTAFLAAYVALLHRYSGADDLVVYSPVANRNRSEIEPLIGFFAVGNLPFRVDARGEPTFAELLDRTRETVRGAFAHSEAPVKVIYEAMSESLPPGVRRQLLPRFRYRLPDEPLRLAGTTCEPYPDWLEVEHLAMWVDEQPAGFQVTIAFDSALFNGDLVRRMLRHFTRLLEQVVADPRRPVSRLALLSGSERQPVAGAPLVVTESLRDLVAAQATRTPDTVALDTAAGTVTYAELLAGRDRLPGTDAVQAVLRTGAGRPVGAMASAACWQRDHYGLGAGDRVVHVPGPGAAAWQLSPWAALVAGATVVVPDDQTGDLATWLAARGVTVASVPVDAAVTLVERLPPALRVLTTWGAWPAGGALPVPDQPLVTSHLLLPDHGGVVAVATPDAGMLSGCYRPSPNIALAVLDRYDEPMPPGAVGELVVSGFGVTVRTGHFAAVRDDGAVEVHGRLVDEVVLRGYRLTDLIGFLELTLREHQDVTQAAVTLTGAGPDVELVGHVVLAPGAALDAAALDAWVVDQAIGIRPTRYAVVDRLPTRADGTVDRNALA